MTEKAEIMDGAAMNRAITRICYEIIERNRGAENLCVIGVLRRGAVLARRMAEKIGQIEGIMLPVGDLDIALYRDDRDTSDTDKSQISFSVEGRKVILVDDVLYTGRSARAAIDAIMDRGRPVNIQLAVLIDRGHRELPLRSDYTGKNLPTSSSEVVKVMVEDYDGVNRVAIFTTEEKEGEAQ